jgi:hypothetical protein
MAVLSANPVTEAPSFWLARSTRTIFFFVAVLMAAGIYLAIQMPISVFPDTNFPRVVIGVDNGVMPVEQMEVTITRPIENAVNSVPGLETVRSTTSRGSAEVSLFFDWNENMVLQLQLVDSALSKVAQTLPATARITTNRLTFASFPILGYALTSDTVAQTRLWEIATYDLHGGRAGGKGARVPCSAEPGAAHGVGGDDYRPGQCDPGVEHRRVSGSLRSQPPAHPGTGGGPGA